MKLSVIVPVLDDPRLHRCLESLMDQKSVSPSDYEVLVVDNGPSQRMCRIVEQFPARYLVETRRGSYAARNRGIEEARGAILAFTDADCVPPADWLETICSAFEDERCRLAVGPSYSLGSSKVALWAQSIEDARWAVLGRHSSVVYCDTRNLAVQREIFDAERFDPHFQTCGDIEFGYRIDRKGESIRVVPRMRLGHDNPTSLWAILRRGIRRGRGLEQFFRRHGQGARISGERDLQLLGRNIKPQLLRSLQLAPLRWLCTACLLLFLGSVLLLLLLLARLPIDVRHGLKPFYLMERASILLGRLLR